MKNKLQVLEQDIGTYTHTPIMALNTFVLPTSPVTRMPSVQTLLLAIGYATGTPLSFWEFGSN